MPDNLPPRAARGTTRRRSLDSDMVGVPQLSLVSFVLETGAYSLLATCLPVLMSLTLFILSEKGYAQEHMLLEHGSTYYNPVEYRNLTVRPVQGFR